MSPKPDRSESKKRPSQRPSQRREVEIDRGVYVVKGVAPEPGTKLTPERIAEDFRVLNRRARPRHST